MGVLIAALIGGVIAAAAAALLAVPVRRLGGVWTAIATLAFAYFFDAVIVKMPIAGGGNTSILQGTTVPRPVLGPFDLNNDKSFLVFVAIVLIVIGAAVVQLRSGTFGKTLLALRGSEVGAQSIGISPARAKIIAFALSGFVAALGGALLAMQQRDVNYANNFSPFGALFWVVIVVTLGSRTVRGAVIAGASFALFEPLFLKGEILGWILRGQSRVPSFFPVSGKWLLVFFGLGTIQFARHPEGIVEYRLHLQALKAQKRRAAKANVGVPASAAVADGPRTEEPVS
jgi:ABC-type branched-subunit amino acid transport system permease subunit